MFLANAAEEFLVRRSPLYEVVGQIGMWGTLINGIQAAGLEHEKMRDVAWNGPIGKFRSPSSRSPGLTLSLKPACCWLIPPHCSSCILRLQSSTGWQAPCSITSTFSPPTFSASFSVNEISPCQDIKWLIATLGLFLYVRRTPICTRLTT